MKIGDFGVSKVFLNKSVVNFDMFGTLPYMSPEVWDGKIMPASDIWALGCVLHEFCSLELTFKSDKKIPMDYKHIIQTQAHKKIPDCYSSKLSKTIDAMLSKDPEKRPTAS